MYQAIKQLVKSWVALVRLFLVLCEAVCVPFGIEPPIYRRRVDFFTKSRAFDITRARTELGFAPRVGLRDGIGRTLEWYREHGWI